MHPLALLGRMFRASEEIEPEFHTTAAVLEAMAMSHGDLSNLLRMALKAQHPGEDVYCWVRDVYDDRVVYELTPADDVSRIYQRTYTVDDAGAVTLGEPVPVVAVTSYVPVTEAEPTTEAGETEITSDVVKLSEKSVNNDGTITMRIIAPGQGSSGYYPADVLKRDGPKVFTAGLHTHLDHPSASEESDRPERSVTTLAGTLTSDARWEENGAAGPGLYADAQVRSDLAPLIEELAPHIGVSIRAFGKSGTREIEGKKTRTIEAIDRALSVDYVTVAGAGGKVMELVEAARTRRTVAPPEEGDTVDKEAFEAAQRKITELEEREKERDKELARLRETELLHQSRQVVVTTLNEIALPAPTRARLTENLAANPPLADGALDKEALVAKVKEAATAEAAYLASVTGGGRVHGMGGTTTTTPEVPTLEESGKRIEAALAAL